MLRADIHQLQLITDVLGTPTEDDIVNIGSEKARSFIRSLPNKPVIPFSQLYPNGNPYGRSFAPFPSFAPKRIVLRLFVFFFNSSP